MGYEEYFSYKKEKNYSLIEYVIFNMYLGNLRGPVSSSKKNKFFTLYTSCLQKYNNLSERPKIGNVSTFFILLIMF